MSVTFGQEMPHEGLLVASALAELSEEEKQALDHLGTLVRRFSARGYPHLAAMVRSSTWVHAERLSLREIRRTTFFTWIDNQTNELIDILTLINARRSR